MFVLPWQFVLQAFGLSARSPYRARQLMQSEVRETDVFLLLRPPRRQTLQLRTDGRVNLIYLEYPAKSSGRQSTHVQGEVGHIHSKPNAKEAVAGAKADRRPLKAEVLRCLHCHDQAEEWCAECGKGFCERCASWALGRCAWCGIQCCGNCAQQHRCTQLPDGDEDLNVMCEGRGRSSDA